MTQHRWVKKKGFTLLELIIVIAIIGIVAAISIPAAVLYSRNSKKQTDNLMADNMNTYLREYTLKRGCGITSLTGYEMRSILLAADYNLRPSLDRWCFVYSIADKAIQLLELEQLNNRSLPTAADDATHIVEGYYLLSCGNTDVENTLSDLLSVRSWQDWDNVIATEVYAKYQGVWQEYSPQSTLYLWQKGEGDLGYFTMADTIVNICYADRIYEIATLGEDVRLALTLGKDGGATYTLPLQILSFEDTNDSTYFD